MRFSDLLGRSLHDLRNPLSVVRASLEWLEMDLTEREEIIDAVRDASTATTRILTILEDLDMLARLESGAELPRGVVDVGATLERVAAATHAQLLPSGVAVVVLRAPPMHVPGDVRLVERALEALVDVCGRAGPLASCVEIDAHVVDVESDSGAVEITIGLRGTVAIEGRLASIDALGNGGIDVYLALRAIEEHGGSLVVRRTQTVPQTIVRLPLA